jgi:hypothetical protein
VAFAGNALMEVRGMGGLLGCIYSKPFEVITLAELEAIIRLSDFYDALPAVSVALDSVLLRSPALIDGIHKQATQYLILATKIRNKTLYKESMVHVAGRWKLNKSGLEDHPELRQKVLIAQGSILDKLDNANIAILKLVGSGQSVVAKVVQRCMQQYGGILYQQRTLPSYYRMLYEDKYTANKKEDFDNYDWNRIGTHAESAVAKMQKILKPVLKNNLLLDRSGESAGEGRHKDYFLYADINDEDLPWNLNQAEW